MATFLDAVNRVLRANSIIGGDDDDLRSFSEVQHVATLEIAKISIQSALTELVSDRIIPYEEKDGTLTMVEGQYSYDLPSDFVRFKGEKPFLLKLDGSSNSENITVNEYPGGEEKLRRSILDYREQSGEPRWFYTIQNAVKRIGMYQVPDASTNGVVYRFPYESTVYVINYTDELPFTTEQEAHAFADMAARRFQFLFTNQPLEGLQRDVVYNTGKANLTNLLRRTNPISGYGYTYS